RDGAPDALQAGQFKSELGGARVTGGAAEIRIAFFGRAEHFKTLAGGGAGGVVTGKAIEIGHGRRGANDALIVFGFDTAKTRRIVGFVVGDVIGQRAEQVERTGTHERVIERKRQCERLTFVAKAAGQSGREG